MLSSWFDTASVALQRWATTYFKAEVVVPVARRAVLGFSSLFVLSYARLLPDVAQRALFTTHLLTGFLGATTLIRGFQLLRALRIISPKTLAGCCAVVSTLCCRWHRFMSANIRIRQIPGSLNGFWAMKTPNAVLVNHRSFMDSVLFLWIVPPLYMMHMRTFYKAQLQKIPLLSLIVRSSRMFPVFFLSDHHSEFGVDRDKQARVAQETEAWLQEGGNISFFPEGGINRKNLTELLPFRHGTFQKIIAHRLSLYYLLHIGTEEVWPPGEAVGGHSATIYVYFGTIEVDYDEPGLDAQGLAQRCHDIMQEKLQWMQQVIVEGRA